LDLPKAILVGIAEKRKNLTSAKLERLRSARLIHGDQETTTRDAMALSKAKGLISLQAPIKYKVVINIHKVIIQQYVKLQFYGMATTGKYQPCRRVLRLLGSILNHAGEIT
jgi:hypothetical protein